MFDLFSYIHTEAIIKRDNAKLFKYKIVFSTHIPGGYARGQIDR